MRPASTTEWEVGFINRLIAELDPRGVYLEIGGHMGGSLATYGSTMDAGAMLISVDQPMNAEAEKSLLATGEKLTSDGFNAHVIHADSHQGTTLQQVQKILAGRPVDVILIDGDHSEKGTRTDAVFYAHLVRKGGMVIFHDCGLCRTRIKPKYDKVFSGINRVWLEIADGKRSILLQEWCGYGVVWM